MIELTMPKLSDSMEEGTILTWLKADGEQVDVGDELVEIETDKATMTHSAEDSGTLRIVAGVGTSLPVGAVIAELTTDAAPRAADESGPDDPPVPRETENRVAVAAPPAAATQPSPENGRPARAAGATPLARRVAAAHGVALDGIRGSGPLGRVTRADVLIAAGIEAQQEVPPAPPMRTPRPPRPAPSAGEADHAAKGHVERRELSRLQAVVARRMAESKATVPHFQVETEVTMDAAMSLRATLKRAVEQAPSLNDMIVKAAALALRDHPLANAAYRDGRFELYQRVNVGIAVATDGGLIVPTIVDADQKSLGAIAADARRLAERVREGTVTPPELSGATFTVSNLGMFGMTAITPVINSPQAAILGVGTIRDHLARVDGEIVDRSILTLRLSCDHRILYGADASRFLNAIRELLETPMRLML